MSHFHPLAPRRLQALVRQRARSRTEKMHDDARSTSQNTDSHQRRHDREEGKADLVPKARRRSLTSLEPEERRGDDRESQYAGAECGPVAEPSDRIRQGGWVTEEDPGEKPGNRSRQKY